MKKINDLMILIAGILLFLISYNYDQQINLFFKNLQFSFLNFALSIIANFGVVIIVLIIVPSIVLYKKNKKLIYLLLLTFFVSFLLAFIIKLIILRQRPIGAFTYPFINIINYSFPSMHAMVAFSLLPVLIKYLNKQKYFWIAFAFLVTFSRIYLGFHFMSDVVFGALFGYFVGDYLLGLFEKKKWL